MHYSGPCLLKENWEVLEPYGELLKQSLTRSSPGEPKQETAEQTREATLDLKNRKQNSDRKTQPKCRE